MSSAVFVLGMARSGTSAVTRVINLLGLSVADADDLVPANEVNPRGFWESLSLMRMNDRILAALGGSWAAPPAFVAGWENDERLSEIEHDARTLFAQLHPTPQWVWKDARTSLTFPFWRRVLDVDPVFALAYRHPLEVARSVDRAGFDVSFGVNPTVSLALWERYNRSALAAAAGYPAYVVGYERLVTNPEKTADDLAVFLRAHGLRLDDGARRAAATSIDPALRRARADETSAGQELSASQQELLDVLRALEGPHDTLPGPDLPAETSWVEPLLVERRRVLELKRDQREAVRRAAGEPRWAFRGLEIRLRWGSTAWRVSRRVRAAAPHRRFRGA